MKPELSWQEKVRRKSGVRQREVTRTRGGFVKIPLALKGSRPPREKKT